MSIDYDRNGAVKPPYYSGYFDLGPIRIPPLLPYTGLVDRVTGVTHYLGQNGTAVVLSTTKPAGINATVYQPFDGPFLPYGTKLGSSSGALVLDLIPEANASAPVWIYSTTNPLGEAYPEPTNYPAPLPPVIPGIPSTSPVPTGGGYAAFNKAQPLTPPFGPPYLTVILTAGMVRHLAWWNGTAWVTPAGVPITGIISP